MRAVIRTRTSPTNWRRTTRPFGWPTLEATRAAGASAKAYWLVIVLERLITVGKQIHKCVVTKLVPSLKLQAPSSTQGLPPKRWSWMNT